MDNNNVLTLAQEVAKHLPGKWEATTNEGSWYATLNGEGTASLHIANAAYNKPDRVVVSGNYPLAPNGNGDYTRYEDRNEKPRITVAKARGAATIAKEITRRVLPAYLRILAVALENKARYEAAETEQHDTAQVICDYLGKPNPFATERNGYSRAYHNIHLNTDRDLDGFSYGTIEVQHGGTVSLTLNSVSEAKALEILEVLKKKENSK